MCARVYVSPCSTESQSKGFSIHRLLSDNEQEHNPANSYCWAKILAHCMLVSFQFQGTNSQQGETEPEVSNKAE